VKHSAKWAVEFALK